MIQLSRPPRAVSNTILIDSCYTQTFANYQYFLEACKDQNRYKRRVRRRIEIDTEPFSDAITQAFKGRSVLMLHKDNYRPSGLPIRLYILRLIKKPVANA